VTSVLEKGSQNAYQVASQMTWDTNCDSWDFFPTLHKWFATGEAAAHLKYLEGKGTVRKEMKNQKIVYSLNICQYFLHFLVGIFLCLIRRTVPEPDKRVDRSTN
jgi:hypothetical protein